MEYRKLLSPIKIKDIILGNRIVAAPMGIMPNHQIISSTNYLGMSAFDRSMGGAGLVHLCAETENIFEKYYLDITKEAINVARQNGSMVSCEIGFHWMKEDNDGFVYGPSEGIRFDGKKMRELNYEQILKFEQDVADQCYQCKKIGFDMITLHIGHDGLGSQFLSKEWNRREDDYGGSVENRIRIVTETLQRIRTVVGENFPIMVRLSRQLMIDESYLEEEMLEAIAYLEPYIDIVNISCGMDVYHKANMYAVPTIFQNHLFNQDFSKQVKQMYPKLIVCLVGSIMTAEEGEMLLQEKYCDLVMYGRALIADPYMPKKIIEGKRADVVPCIKCMHCYHIATGHWNVQCSVNPRFRRENRFSMYDHQYQRKTVAVIGGGPSGIVSALAASQNGHAVTLFEKSDRLGGLLNFASVGELKQDLRYYLDYLLNQIQKSNVHIRLNVKDTKQELEKANFDEVIVAIGSSSRNLNSKQFHGAIDICQAIEQLNNIDGPVTIIGGGSAGCELALELDLLGKEVHIFELGDTLASNGNILYRNALLSHIQKTKIHIHLNTKVKSYKKNQLDVFENNKYKSYLFKTCIQSIGRMNKIDEVYSYYSYGKKAVMVGDCYRPGSLVDAINHAYFIGKNI